MLSIGEKALIQDLLKAGVSVQETAVRTGRSVSTIYNYRHVISNQHPKIHVLNAEAPRKNYKPAVRIETGPGEQAQVDWGSFGQVTIGDKKEKLYAFVFTLSYSRMMYVEFVIRQNLQTLLNCHIHAFEALGVPGTIRYDNMKTVVLSHIRRKGAEPKITYNPAFLDFARYYGFIPEACPPYWPRAKGKVERSVRYIRNSFAPSASMGKKFIDLYHLNQQTKGWLNTISHRMHRSVNERPVDRYHQEAAKLMQVTGLPRYTTTILTSRMSTKDGLVAYKGNLYSIPQYLARRKLYIREKSKGGIAILEIYYKDMIIASHTITTSKGEWIIQPEHSMAVASDDNKRVKSTKQPHTTSRHDISVTTRTLNYYDER